MLHTVASSKLTKILISLDNLNLTSGLDFSFFSFSILYSCVIFKLSTISYIIEHLKIKYHTLSPSFATGVHSIQRNQNRRVLILIYCCKI